MLLVISIIPKISSDIRKSRLCSAQSTHEPSGQMAEGVPNINQGEGARMRTPLMRFGQGLSYSPNCLVSQSATLQERSVQGCKRAEHKIYSPLGDHWVILTVSNRGVTIQEKRIAIIFRCIAIYCVIYFSLYFQ